VSEEVYVAVTLLPATALALIAPAPVTICHDPVIAPPPIVPAKGIAVPVETRQIPFISIALAVGASLNVTLISSNADGQLPLVTVHLNMYVPYVKAGPSRFTAVVGDVGSTMVICAQAPPL
jgi:hypothetical protein